jgi:proline dehydrogenase
MVLFTTCSSLGEAVGHIRRLNEQGVKASLSFLPVRKDGPEEVKAEAGTYRAMLAAIREHGLDADITLKLHQFGIYTDPKLAEKTVTDIVGRARKAKTFVWIDMERPGTVDATLKLYDRLHHLHGNAGICLQAYLKRTEQDLADMLRIRAPVRLVKGFYKGHDITDWPAVTLNYARLMEALLIKGHKPAIATHDLGLIEHAKELIRKHGVDDAELQFFSGVRDSLAPRLAREGFNIRVYLAYGSTWRFLLHGFRTFDNWRNLQRLLGVKTLR